MRVVCISKILGAGLKLYDYGTSPEAILPWSSVLIWFFDQDNRRAGEKSEIQGAG